tara:strand:+ start:101 stop:1006 length:906 start_codon:yes stop_codon:yes gene_type:complete
MIIDKKNLKENFDKSLIFNETLSKYSWFNIGGPAEIFFRPDNENQLIEFIKKIKNLNLEINIIGAGSNTLIRDGGIKGITIKLSSKFSYCNLFDNNTVEVGAATLDKNISNFAMKNSISGMEFLSCIPGTIGGSIIMNSGCYNHEISKILTSIKTINHHGEVKIIESKDIKFGYRKTNLPRDLIIISAMLKGKKEEKNKIEKMQTSFIEKKKLTQPSQVKTCGSTFKNPKDKKAWDLIGQSDCGGLKVGKAKISEKHFNFFINEGNASSSEVEELINLVKDKVYKKTGVNLELEIKLIGEN